MRPEIGTIHVLVDIDDHKRAEAHLAECNAQLELAGKAARVGSLAIDLSTALVDLSPGCAMILGLPESTLQTSRDTARKLVHPEDIAQLDAARDQALRKKEREFVTQFRILRADDGEVRWLEVRSQIFYNPGGEPLRLIAVIIDFTDRKRAEDTLHQREAELVEAQRLARIGSWHWDAESDVAVGSEELLRIFGLDLGTRRLPSYREQRGRWYPVDDWKWLKAAIQSTMQTGVSYELELQALRNGTPIWITARGAVVRNSTDQIVGLRGTVQEITDRKLAELALAERNTQLELASKTARVGSFSVDLSTGVVKLTSGCTTIFGLPEGTTEISRDDGRKLVHREDLPLLAVRHDHALLAQQREVIAQFRIVRADDGEVRWIEARNLIFYDLRGKPAHLIGVSIDFTERKIAEEMLAERNLQLEVAGKVGLVGSYAFDTQTERIQISPGYAAIYGLPGRTTEITHGEWLAYVHPEDAGGLQVRRSKTFHERREEYKTDYRIVRRDGETRWIESRGVILYGRDGRALRVIGVNIDVTERKRAELALAERNTQLELASKAARVGCYSNNLETGVITVSEGYATIHGLPEGAVQTTLSQWRTRVHPDDLAPFDELREHIFANRRRDFTFDYRLIRADGGIRWIELRGCIAYGEDGLPQQCIGINIDVTERKQTEAHLSDALSVGRVVAFEWDAATFRSQRSDNAEHILGILQGGSFLRQVHPADRRKFKALIRNLSPGNPSYRLIFRFAHADSRHVWLEEEAKAEFDTKGKLPIKRTTRVVRVSFLKLLDHDFISSMIRGRASWELWRYGRIAPRRCFASW